MGVREEKTEGKAKIGTPNSTQHQTQPPASFSQADPPASCHRGCGCAHGCGGSACACCQGIFLHGSDAWGGAAEPSAQQGPALHLLLVVPSAVPSSPRPTVVVCQCVQGGAVVQLEQLQALGGPFCRGRRRHQWL